MNERLQTDRLEEKIGAGTNEWSDKVAEEKIEGGTHEWSGTVGANNFHSIIAYLHASIQFSRKQRASSLIFIKEPARIYKP